MRTKVRVGNAFCMCHGHYVRRAEDGTLVSELGRHDGARTYIERRVLLDDEPLAEKAKALFRLHSEETPIEEKVAILKKYGEEYRTFSWRGITSNFVGDTTLDGKVVSPGDAVFFNEDLFCK